MRRKVMTVVLLVGLGAMGAGIVLIWPAIYDVLSGQGLPNTSPPTIRPANWAQPLNLPEVENLHRISETLYRGAQPTEAGMRRLAEMGIRTIVNLRAGHNDADEIGELNLQRVDIPTEPWDLKPQQVVEFLKIVTDPQRQPVFFHCRQGSDRTGAMAAAYRIVVQGWTKQEAIEEMTRGGYGFHRAWAGVVDFVQNLPVEDIRCQVNTPEPTTDRANASAP